jgi:GT2 family glycosyltransferase
MSYNFSTAIVILTWNDWKNTICALDSVIQSNHNNYDIILVDNNSYPNHLSKIRDWSLNKIFNNDINLKKFFKKKNINIINTKKNNIIINKNKKNIYLIKNKKNIGLTAGLNIGYNFALKNKYKYIFRIDNDIIVKKNTLKELIKLLENKKEIVAISPKINHGYLINTVWWYNFKMTWFYLKFQKTMNLNKYRIADNSDLKGLINTDSICGCCSVYRSSSLLKSGLGDEDFFYGPEDIELSYRLKKFGLLKSNLNSLAFHKIARSSVISGLQVRKYNEIKGFLTLIKKIGSRSDKIVGYTYFFLRIFYYLLLIKKKNGKETFKGYTRACYDFFKI